MLEELDNHADPDCVKAYQKAADQIKLLTNDDYDTFLLFMLESVH
jgi:hypothetical protein